MTLQASLPSRLHHTYCHGRPALFPSLPGGTHEPATASELPVETIVYRQGVPNLGIDSHGDQEREGLIGFKQTLVPSFKCSDPFCSSTTNLFPSYLNKRAGLPDLVSFRFSSSFFTCLICFSNQDIP